MPSFDKIFTASLGLVFAGAIGYSFISSLNNNTIRNYPSNNAIDSAFRDKNNASKN